MKTQNWNFVKSALLFAASVMAAMTFAACGKNSGGNSTPAPTFVPPVTGFGTGGCSSCPGGSGLVASAVGQYGQAGSDGSELALEFYGQGVQNTTPNTGSYGQTSYQGQIAVQGTFTMQQNSQLCGIPQGVYQVTTQSPGVWQGQSFAGITMIGQGPTQIQLAFDQAGAYITYSNPAARSLDGRQFPYRMQGYLYVRGSQAMGNWCQMVLL